jgi:hypothetical protein
MSVGRFVKAGSKSALAAAADRLAPPGRRGSGRMSVPALASADVDDTARDLTGVAAVRTRASGCSCGCSWSDYMSVRAHSPSSASR